MANRMRHSRSVGTRAAQQHVSVCGWPPLAGCIRLKPGWRIRGFWVGPCPVTIHPNVTDKVLRSANTTPHALRLGTATIVGSVSGTALYTGKIQLSPLVRAFVW